MPQLSVIKWNKKGGIIGDSLYRVQNAYVSIWIQATLVQNPTLFFKIRNETYKIS